MQPPAGFASTALLQPRGALLVAAPGQEALLDTSEAELRPHAPRLQRLDRAAVLARVPVLRPEQVIGGLFDPDAADIDVHALHQGFLRGARANGAQFESSARVTALARTAGGWRVSTPPREWRAAVVVDAAGAWADEGAQLAGVAPIGLQPRRRAAFLFAPPAGVAVADWPCVVGLDESWYFKPDAGMLLGSPANADPVAPHDVVPEELDIATGINRIERMTTLTIRRPSHTWAGLRSFVADGDLVAGFDPAAPGFFWVAAQGGYGIQTAPAMGALCAAKICGEVLPEAARAAGVTWRHLDVARLRGLAP